MPPDNFKRNNLGSTLSTGIAGNRSRLVIGQFSLKLSPLPFFVFAESWKTIQCYCIYVVVIVHKKGIQVFVGNKVKVLCLSCSRWVDVKLSSRQ